MKDCSYCKQWFDRTTALSGKLQLADWYPILRPLFHVLPKALNPIKRKVEELEEMETQMWIRHTTVARVLIDSGNPNASKKSFGQAHLDILYSGTCLGFVRDLQDRAANEKDRLTEKEILFSAGHAYAAATYVSYSNKDEST